MTRTLALPGAHLPEITPALMPIRRARSGHIAQPLADGHLLAWTG